MPLPFSNIVVQLSKNKTIFVLKGYTQKLSMNTQLKGG
jgi:hypothetical protein